MSKYLRYGFVEDLDTVRHISLGDLGGIRISITPVTWLGPFLFFGLGLALNALGPEMSLRESLYQAWVFMLAVEITTLLHATGHILGGKLVQSPMDELLITATRGVNIYRGDQDKIPSSVHLGRALGGPLLNLAVAGVLYLLLPILNIRFAVGLLESLASTNLFFGAGSFLPLPSVDGQVIWREALYHLRLQLRPDKTD